VTKRSIKQQLTVIDELYFRSLKHSKHRSTSVTRPKQTIHNSEYLPARTHQYILHSCIKQCNDMILYIFHTKMVNGSQFYRALESVSIASASSSALTIYPSQIRVHQTLTVLNSQLLTARKEWWPATADSLPQATMIHTTLAGI